VEKAIRAAGLGLNPIVDGRRAHPDPAADRGAPQGLAKLAGKYAEQQKVAVRNVRRDAMDEFKKARRTARSARRPEARGDEVQGYTDAASSASTRLCGQGTRDHAGLMRSVVQERRGARGNTPKMTQGRDAAALDARAPAGPRHVAIIMDGNGRWAKARGLPRAFGHRSGVNALKRTVECAPDLGIEILTVFGFSTENWGRPASEVAELMGLLRAYVESDLARLEREGVRVRVLGRRTGLSVDIQEIIARAERRTAHNDRFELQVAFNYGGRAISSTPRARWRRRSPRGAYVPTRSTRRCWAECSPRAMRRRRTSSYAPAASTASPTSCCGKRPTRSSSFKTCSGPTTAPTTCRRRSISTGVVNDGSAAFRPVTCLPQAKAAFDGRDLRLRLLSAALLGPATLLAAWVGGWLLFALVTLAAVFLAREWGFMSAPRRPARVTIAVAAAVLVALAFAAGAHWYTAWFSLGFGSLVAAAVARGFSERRSDAAFGALYIGAPCLIILWLRTGEQGHAWLLALLLVVWAADGGAFFVGKLVGGPKLWPRFSPNKTWAGFVGGLAAAAAAALAHCQLIGPDLSFVSALALGLLTGAAAMAGDLWESMLKRRFGVKDSGDLIPGTAACLDRAGRADVRRRRRGPRPPAVMRGHIA
jgi:phosphatidate cytidylyltransferase